MVRIDSLFFRSHLTDIKKEICCNETVNPRLSGGCCGNKSYDLLKSKCCNGVLGSIINFRKSALCCGSVVYDSLQYKCCNGTIMPIKIPCIEIIHRDLMDYGL